MLCRTDASHLRAGQNQPREFVVGGDAGAESVAREQKDRAANDNVYLQQEQEREKGQERELYLAARWNKTERREYS